MKRLSFFTVTSLLVFLYAAGTTQAQAQSNPHSIFYASKDVAILRTAAGYPDVLKRIDRFYERMVDTFTMFGGHIKSSDFHIETLSNGEQQVMCRNRVIITVTRADARSYGVPVSTLARRWERGFAATIPESQQYVAENQPAVKRAKVASR